MENIYSFRLQTQCVAAVLMEVCSLSLMCEIPLEIKEIVTTGSEEDQVSFKLFMNEPTKDMAVRIFFQLPGITSVQMFESRRWQILENPFFCHADNQDKECKRPGKGV